LAFGCGVVIAWRAVILVVQNWRLHTEVAKLRSGQIQRQRQIDSLQQQSSNASAGASGKSSQDRSETQMARVLNPPSEVAIWLSAGQTRQAGTSNTVNC